MLRKMEQSVWTDRTLVTKKNQRSASTDEEYATSGPLTRLFKNPIARILDQSLIVGQMEQTISMLMDSTNLSYKTVQKTINQLLEMKLVEPSRKIGNAQTYRFRVDNHLSDLVTCARALHKIQEEAESE
jgi:DNA-binding transcriptional ArsR family regulator